MSELLMAACIMAGLAGLFGTILALAYRFLRVEEDPRLGEVEEMLPGSNCGACGMPGCRAFAEQVVAGSISPGKCSVSSRAGVERIAAFLGVDAAREEKRVARLHCAAGEGLVKELADYRGVQSCRAAMVVNSGSRACAWGCLGLADCERACTFDAIHMNQEGMPVVNVDACTACNDCVEVCPLNLFTIEPLSQKLIVQCSSPLTGERARNICKVACDGCERCVMDAIPGTLEMEDGLPRIRRPDQTSVDCIFRCPTGAIRWIEGDQFQAQALERKRGVVYG